MLGIGSRARGCTFALLALFLQPLAGAGEPYTLVFIPDTQYVPADADTVHQQVQWILDNKADRNIVFVGHLGDVVDDPSETEKFLNISDAMSLLQGGPIEIPYSVVPGNHDTTPVYGFSYADYLVYFGPERYTGFSWFGGASPNLGSYTATENNSKDVNHYSFIDTGNGYEILHLGMEYRQAHPTISNWARSVIAAHPGMPILITSHRNVEILNIQTGACGTLDDGRWWDNLLRHEANIFLTVNGHEFANVDCECHFVRDNDAGFNVVQMLSNYQQLYYRGQGWLRIITVDDVAGTLTAETYSPILDIYQTDANSAFVVPVDVQGRFFPTTDADGDGIEDISDNCLQLANPLQADTDQDGYGNHCDGDFDGSGSSDGIDFASHFIPAFGTGVDTQEGTDMNADGFVDGIDFDPLFLDQFLSGNPGPSGLSCAGTTPCP